MENKLEDVKKEMTTQIQSLESKIIMSMQQQVESGMSMQTIDGKIEPLTIAAARLLEASQQNISSTDTMATMANDSTLLGTQNADGDESTKTSSTGSSQEIISSPQHKRHRSLTKYGENTEDMEFCTPESSDYESDTQLLDAGGGFHQDMTGMNDTNLVHSSQQLEGLADSTLPDVTAHISDQSEDRSSPNNLAQNINSGQSRKRLRENLVIFLQEKRAQLVP